MLQRWTFAISLVLLLLVVGSGAGWNAASDHAVLAVRGDHTASAPLYGAVASAFVMLPAGEPGFRLAVLDALLGAALLAGVVATARALAPKAPLVGLVGVALLLLAPGFRDAAGFAGPAILAAAGTVWLFASVLAYTREPASRRALHALGCAAVVCGAAPWLGLAWVALVAVLARRMPPLAIAGLGALVIALWWRAQGSLPGLTWTTDLAGGSPILVGVGLAGALFGALTGAPGARWLAAGIAVALAHALLFSADVVPLLALLAVAAAIVPAAVARVVTARHAAPLAGVPIVIAALLVSPALRIDDPGDAPARLAGDVIGWAPPGPGAIITYDRTAWSAIAYASIVAGARPDLDLAPLRATDRIAVIVMRANGIVVSDQAEFGMLDARRALPRGRGFQLMRNIPAFLPATAPAPADYASRVGRDQSVRLALERARYEGIIGRFDVAAHAAGQAERFRAADLAILATTRPVHPAMFRFVPAFTPRGPWLLDLFGDDLAWVAGLGQPELPSDAPLERQLHARWRALWLGGNAKIHELGPTAVIATAEMLYALTPR